MTRIGAEFADLVRKELSADPQLFPALLANGRRSHSYQLFVSIGSIKSFALAP